LSVIPFTIHSVLQTAHFGQRERTGFD